MTEYDRQRVNQARQNFLELLKQVEEMEKKIEDQEKIINIFGCKTVDEASSTQKTLESLIYASNKYFPDPKHQFWTDYEKKFNDLK
jgi:hypothetical protein